MYSSNSVRRLLFCLDSVTRSSTVVDVVPRPADFDFYAVPAFGDDFIIGLHGLLPWFGFVFWTGKPPGRRKRPPITARKRALREPA